MATEYALKVKHVKIWAYVGNVKVPITNGSVNMTPSGYRFSIGIPPSKSSLKLKYGTYGYIMFADDTTGGAPILLCDGYLINDSFTANRGVFIRQLVFADCFDAMRFFYIDDSFLNINTEDCGADSNTMYCQLKTIGGIDLIGRDKTGGIAFGPVPRVLGEMVSGKYNASESVQQLKEEGETTEVKNVVDKFNDEMMKKAESILSTPGPFFSYLHALSGQSDIAKRYLIYPDRLWQLTEVGKLQFCEGAIYHVTTSVIELAMKWMYGSAGIMDYSSMLYEALEIFMLQPIIVPGMTSGQVIILPKTPFLPVIKKWNEIDANYEEISVSYNGDVPCTTSVYASNILNNNDGNKLSTMNDIFGIAGGSESSFGNNSYIQRLHHEYYNLASRIFSSNGNPKTKEEDKDKYKSMMDAMARFSLSLEVARNNSVTISSSYPHFSIVPGFGMKVGVPGYQSIYGRVEQVNIYFEHMNVATSITLSNILNVNSDGENPYKNYGLVDAEYINMYTKGSAKGMIDTYKSFLEGPNRHNVLNVPNMINANDNTYGNNIKKILGTLGEVFSEADNRSNYGGYK